MRACGARFLPIVLAAALSACGGGSSKSASSSNAGPAPVQMSTSSPLPSGCGNTSPLGINGPTGETATIGSAVQPEATAIPSGNAVAVWEQDRWTGLGARGILASNSSSNGATWSTPVALPFSVCGDAALTSYDRTSDPSVTFAGGGTVVATALGFSANGYVENSFVANGATNGGTSAVLLSRSTDGGATWSKPPLVIWQDLPATSASGTAYFNDRDSVTADPASGNVYVVWDRLSSGGIAAGVPAWLALLPNGASSSTGNSTGVLYNPGLGFQTFNNQISVLPNGKVVDIFTLFDVSSNSSLQALQVGTFTAGAWSTSAPVTIVQNFVSNGTPNPAPAATSSIRDARDIAQTAVDPATGAIAVVWQQAFSGNTSFDGIALSVSTDSGATWSAPRQINGSTGVAAFNPGVRYLPGSVLAVTYYDLRDYTSGSNVLNTDVWLTESSDGGSTWHELRLQAPFDLNRAPLTNTITAINGFGATSSLFLGDNQGLAVVGANPLPVYAATSSSGAHVYAQQPLNPMTAPGAHAYTAH